VARRRLGVLVPVLALPLLVGSPALAAWVVSSTGADSAARGTALSAPTGAASTVTGSSVSLTWVAPATGPVPTGYTVQRTSPTSAAVCVAVAVTTCTDTGLTPTTTYSYSVTALRGLWASAPLGASATTATPLPSAFVLTVPPTATAGTQFAITIQARKSDGTDDTAYTGAHALSFSGPGTVNGNAPVYPATATFNANGFANNVQVRLYKAEATTITVSDGDPSRTGVSGTVTVAAGTASSLRWTTDAAGLVEACSGGSLVVGPGGQRSWYVAVLDQYGNRAVQGATARQINISRSPGGASGGTATPTALTVLANANPAVTSTSTVLKLKKKSPAATTFTAASSPAAGVSSVLCVLTP